MIFNKSHLIELGIDDKNAYKYANHLIPAMERYEINTPERKSHFLSQVAHESGMFVFSKESLYYSTPEAIMKAWSKRFPTVASTNGLLKNPNALAEKVYGGRLGNVSGSGDALKFCGRGLIQCTGRENYTKCGKYLGLDLVNHPELLEKPEYAVLSAIWFWNTNNLNKLADVGSLKQVEPITRIINGGTNGLQHRKDLYNKAIKIFGV